MIDSRCRSFVKALVWRIIGIIILGIVTYVVTGSWKDVGIITIIFHGIRVVLYYYHERIWEKIKWGRSL